MPLADPNYASGQFLGGLLREASFSRNPDEDKSLRNQLIKFADMDDGRGVVSIRTRKLPLEFL